MTGSPRENPPGHGEPIVGQVVTPGGGPRRSVGSGGSPFGTPHATGPFGTPNATGPFGTPNGPGGYARTGPNSAPGMGNPMPSIFMPRQRSVFLAGLLALLLGPLGMIYATIPGFLVTGFLTLVVTIVTLGQGWFFFWPLCVVWAVMATSRRNRIIRAMAAAGY